KIRVIARLRPRLPGEPPDSSLQVVHVDGRPCVEISNLKNTTTGSFQFQFTNAHPGTATQENIFEQDILPMLEYVYSGITVTIFAYGVTSSGKTHTMQGTKEEPGVIPRVVQVCLRRAMTLASSTMIMSYMEIYKDEAYDLLVQREKAQKLPIRENGQGVVFVANLTSVEVDSVEEFNRLYNRANKQRSVASTNLNHASSRSHAILTLEARSLSPETGARVTCRINLVDLAGSENNNHTGNDAQRMVESSAINKSLSALGQVVDALNRGDSRIPYRNSRLTRVLSDALGGSSLGLIICNVAPGERFRQDTLNTLKFACKARNIESKTVVNERTSPPTTNIPLPPSKPGLASRPSMIAAPRPSMFMAPRSSMAVAPRPSTAGAPWASALPARTGSAMLRAGTVPFQVGSRASSVCGSRPSSNANTRQSSGGPLASISGTTVSSGLPVEDLEEKIRQLVEVEVTKRLTERESSLGERENEFRLREQEIREREKDIPSGIITPLLKHRKDLDNIELLRRLQDLERRCDDANNQGAFAEALTPVSKKKAGRAYVALARDQTQKRVVVLMGDLQAALDLYCKARTFVPDNVKLKERWI
ncbi:kinesin-domain-containing protein, partial [Fistulina hepatica ATCC 64428]